MDKKRPLKKMSKYEHLNVASDNKEVNITIEDKNKQDLLGSHNIFTGFKLGFSSALIAFAYLDPGNLESDLYAGATTGYQLIWVLFMSTVMGFVLQVLAAKLGSVTGKHLAELCRENYPRWASNILWAMTELAIIGSDIQEVIGSAIAFKLLFGWPLFVGCIVTGLDTFTFLYLHNFGMRKLELFFAILITIMVGTFFTNFFHYQLVNMVV